MMFELIQMVTILVCFGVIIYQNRMLQLAYQSRKELHVKYMGTLQQLTQSSIERFALMQRLSFYEPVEVPLDVQLQIVKEN
jgi:hypothetical protein